MSDKYIFYINIAINTAYIFAIICIFLSFTLYKIIYPQYVNIYILKLIVSAILLSIKSSPICSITKETNLILHILLWFSMLSILPDAVRCILIYL